MSTSTSSWQDTAALARSQLSAAIAVYDWPTPEVSDDVTDVTGISLEAFLSPLHLEITETSDVGVLLENIASSKWLSEEVLRAFCHRALIAHKLTNCLTGVFFDRAIARAQELDRQLAETGKTVGPLHGLPISLKSQISVEGLEANIGYVAWSGKLAEKNSVMTDMLLQQGAVLYVHTNVPQSLMLTESVNNIWGKTSNPFNRTLTCGGSSGGEGALIGMKGSPLGVGSDIGGSIRIPAAFQGLYGLKPSYNRVPYEGSVNSFQGQEVVASVLGPISSSINGLAIFTRAILAAQPWRHDPAVRRVPWDEEAYKLGDHGKGKGKMCFGIVWDDGVVKPSPPYKRALEMTKKALEKAGHEVVDWSFPDASKGVDIISQLYTADGGKDITSDLEISGEPRIGWLLKGDEPHLSTYDYWQLCRKKNEYLKSTLDALEGTVKLTSTGRPFDGVISPVSAHAAEKHGKEQYIGYTSLINLLDYAAGVFPVTKVDAALDVKPEAHKFRSALDEEIYNRWDPKEYADAPISLQLIGRRGEEEAVIRLTEIVDEALKASA